MPFQRHLAGLWRPGQSDSNTELRLNQRSRRVALLLAAAVALSAVDLFATLGYMTTSGMFEANPIVVYLAEQAWAASLITVYKLLTVSIAVGLLFRLRRYLSAELGAWFIALTLTGLCAQWVLYANQAANIDATALNNLAKDDPHWIVLE